MARRFIAELKPGDTVDDEAFLVRSKDLRTTTNGSLYIHAILTDRTGQIPARMWQATEGIFQLIPEGGFVRLKGRAENYKGNMQFIIDTVRPAAPETLDMTDFLPRTKRDIDEMFGRVREILETVENPHLKVLLEEFLLDDDLMRSFRHAPAATSMHHAYVGGLLEHTLTLLEIALRVLPLYPNLSRDLVLTGLFLHDMGKTRELAYATTVTYSDEGQLLGHIVQGAIMVERKAALAFKRTGTAVPPEVRWQVQHIVVSHHGRYEFGSPRLPATPEAIAVHYIDNLDAKINIFSNEIENDRDPAATWTNYNRGIETKVYKPDVFGVRGGSRET